MWNQIENQLLIKFKQNQKVKNRIGDVRFSLANHQITPGNWFKIWDERVIPKWVLLNLKFWKGVEFSSFLKIFHKPILGQAADDLLDIVYDN